MKLRAALGAALPPRRLFLLGFLFLAVTSCVRARTVDLRPPEPPAYAHLEVGLTLPGSEEGLRVEGYLVRPRARGSYPCAVLLHGRGGWWRAYIRYGRALAARGIAALILNYYSAHYVDWEGQSVPFAHRRRQFDHQNHDIARATAAFARSPLCAGGKVGLVGFSLGADKAIRTAAGRPEVGAVVAYYGPYDYVSFIRKRVGPLLLAIASEDSLRWKSYLEENSPLLMAHKVRAPVLLFHGTEDRLIPVRQSLRMLEALRRREEGKARLRLYEGVGHNFILWRGTKAERADSIRLAVAFFRQNLPPPAKGGRTQARPEGGAAPQGFLPPALQGG